MERKVIVPDGDYCVIPDKVPPCGSLMISQECGVDFMDLGYDERYPGRGYLKKSKSCLDACKEEVARDKSDYNFNEPA